MSFTMPKVKIEGLRPYPGNARRSDVELIAESLRELGQYKPIVVNKGNTCASLANTVLAGNHTMEAAKTLGWSHIDVTWVDVDEETAKRIVLVDNRSNDVATYDVKSLLNLVTDLPDYTATGFTQDEVDALLEVLENQADDLADDAGDAPDDGERGFGLIVECDSENQRDNLKAKLLAEGFNVGNA